MKLRKIGFNAFIIIFATVLATCFSPLLVPFCEPQVFAQTPEERKAEAERLLNQGYERLQNGHSEQALPFLKQALILYREIGDRRGEGLTLHNMGGVYFRLGLYAHGLELFEQALAVRRELGDLVGVELILYNLGVIYYNLGEYSQAREFHQQALDISRELGDSDTAKMNLYMLGLIYDSLAQYNQALEMYRQALDINLEINENIGTNIAAIYSRFGEYEKALESYQQSLTIYIQREDRQGQAAIIHNIGAVYAGLGQYSKALESYQQALAIEREIGDSPNKAKTLSSLGAIYEWLRDVPQALNYYQQALDIYRKLSDRRGEGESLNNIGAVHLKSGNAVEATNLLHNAIEVWESLRFSLKDTTQVSLFEKQAHTYRLLQQALVVQAQTQEALEIAERGRTRTFVELLLKRLSPETEASSRIPYPTIEEIKQIAHSQKSTIVEYSIIYDSVKGAELYIWVIKPTGEVIFYSIDINVPPQQNISLTNLVPRVRQSMGVRGNEVAFKAGDRIHFKDDTANSEPWEIISVDAQNGTLRVRLPSFAPGAAIPRPITEVEDFGQTSLQQLHQILIEPIADLLPKNPSDRIIFIPQGELFLVPFAALQDKEGKYLIEKHTILTAPSIQVLDLTRKQRQRVANSTAKNVLVVGNPSPMPKPFAPLEYAAPEAKAIANLLNTNPIIGTEATESAIVAQMPNARIVHLATHGQFDDIRGLGSAIALAPSGKDDGLLTAEEILNLKLNAELVVLSACDTGRGRLTGDGVIGLSRSLISAGVPSVIVSLWKVPDNTTSGLMVEFYRQLDNNPDKAQALRQAMLTTMKQHPNPRDWAAFTLIGEAE